MVITEENGNPFTEQSLADQLMTQDSSEEQGMKNPDASLEPVDQEDHPMSVDKMGSLGSEQVQQAMSIEGIGSEPQQSEQKTSDLDLLDDTQELSVAPLWEMPTYSVKKYNRGFILSVLGIVLCLALGYVSYLFYQYLNLKSRPEVPADKIERLQKTSDIYDEYGAMLWLFDLDQYASLSLAQQGEDGARKVLQDDHLNFVQKKDLLSQSLRQLGSEIIELREQSKILRENLNKDWFFPQELVDILKKENAVGSIQRSLLSLEVVKFSSAMKVFSLMDVFISSLADNLGYTKSDIREKLDELITRGEKDIEYYLNVCYNNPYEPVKCDKVDDFNNYYKRILGDRSFDTSFFKVLMEYINNNLEYSNMPSFSITFNSFDGKSNSIGFTVEVNTLKEDEYALIQQGIKSPHIFIVSELIKLLKQSTFIVGKAIDAKDIKVNPKQVTIGASKYVVNNSIKNFVLPIQKGTEREIFDFVDRYTLNLQERGSEHKENAETQEEPLLQESSDMELPREQAEAENEGAFLSKPLE